MIRKEETSDFGIKYLTPGSEIPDALRLLEYDSAAMAGQRGGIKPREPLDDFQHFEHMLDQEGSKVPFDLKNREGSWWLHPDVMSLLHMKNATPTNTAQTIVGIPDIAPVSLGSQWRNYSQSAPTEPMIESFLEHDEKIPLDNLVQLDLPMDMNRNELNEALRTMALRRINNPNNVSDPIMQNIIDKYSKGSRVPESVEDIIRTLASYRMPLSGASEGGPPISFEHDEGIAVPNLSDINVQNIIPDKWQHDNTPNDLQQLIQPYDVNRAAYPLNEEQQRNREQFGIPYLQPLDPRRVAKGDDLSGLAERINQKNKPPTFIAQNLDPKTLPCRTCGNKILSTQCPTCGRPPSLGSDMRYSEPMDLAWRLLKKDGEPWAQPQYESEMREKEKLSTKHGKMSESSLPHAREHGLDRSPLSVHYGHRGKGRLRPLTLEPEKYAQYQGQRQLRSLMGGISMPKTIMGRSPSGERDMHIPSEPAPPKQLAIQAPKVPHDVKPPKIKDMTIKSMREDISDIKKKMNYMEFNQLRRLLRRLKGKVDDREQALKAHAAPGENNETGIGDGGTTAPHGPTENIEQEEMKRESTGKMLVGPSGRTA